MTDLPTTPGDGPNLPVASRIRARIQQAKRRFHANDNIAAFVAPGELDALLDEVESKMVNSVVRGSFL